MKLKVKKKRNLTPIKKESKESEPEIKYASLGDVMDMSRPFSIFYSGVETESYLNTLYDMGIRNFLMSYHYIQKIHMSMDKKFSGKGIKFFIDSGAFTYQIDPKYSEYTIEMWEEQIQRYLKWTERNKDYIFAIANLDLEEMLGGEVVRRWNEKYFEPFMLRTGIPVCFVWHPHSACDWEYYCKRYPYTGYSNDIEGVNHMEMLKVAENHNTLIHGFAMTKTKLLTNLPFYTVDSTTWMAGVQYGEVNFWNGSKMSRLKKDKWKGSMLPTLVEMGFDKEKLLAEDIEEMIKVNARAFMDAEEYVQTRLKSRMYWMKEKEIKRTSIDGITFPSPEWCDSTEIQNADWEGYAKEFNISREDRDTAINCIFDITCFLNWENEMYKEVISRVYTPELINSIHSTWINRIVESDEERVSDLQNFFKEVLLGNETKLLYLGTNFDRVVKERDEYLDDTEFDYEEVSPLELKTLTSSYLLPGEDGSAPEVDELDDEIFEEHGIVPIRNDKGQLIKGQKVIHRPKQVYSKKFPKMSCDTCYNAQKCPEYRQGYVCAYNKIFSKFNTRDMADIIQAMQGIVGFSLERLQRSMLSEVMNGGVPTADTSSLMHQTMTYLNQLKNMYENGSSEVLKQTHTIYSDGTQETTTQVTNPQSGGILMQIFGGMGQDKEDKKEEDIVDVPVKESEEGE